MKKWFNSLSWEEIQNKPSYKQASEYARNFEAIEGKSYQWVYTHALEQFRDVTDTINDLDRKAYNMIRYLAPSSGIVSLMAGIIALTANYPWIILVLFVGTVLIICAMTLSAFAVLPQQQCLLPTVTEAFSIANHFKTEEDAKAYWAACIQTATEAKSIVADLKARRIAISYKMFVAALAWLFLTIPIVLILIA